MQINNEWHFDFKFTPRSFGLGFLISGLKCFGFWEIYLQLACFEIAIDNEQ